QYQLTVEPVDPTWSQLVGPYGPWQVQPSGTAQPIIVTTNLAVTLRRTSSCKTAPLRSRTGSSPRAIHLLRRCLRVEIGAARLAEATTLIISFSPDRIIGLSPLKSPLRIPRHHRKQSPARDRYVGVV